MFIFATMFRPTLRRVHSSGVKRSVREANRSPEVENMWSDISTSYYIFMGTAKLSIWIRRHILVLN
jgi:hypothetical protein